MIRNIAEQRLLRSGVIIPHVLSGDPLRIVVESYPGAIAKRLVKVRSYKSDTQHKQTIGHLQVRLEILAKLKDYAAAQQGLKIHGNESLCQDSGGDHLDALLCAVQVARFWTMRDKGFGAPANLITSEGWIADPAVTETHQQLKFAEAAPCSP